jgi:hypothetical protein
MNRENRRPCHSGVDVGKSGQLETPRCGGTGTHLFTSPILARYTHSRS